MVRVHRELLLKQRLPAPLVSKKIWAERFDDINAFERHLRPQQRLIRSSSFHVSKRDASASVSGAWRRPQNWQILPRHFDVHERGTGASMAEDAIHGHCPAATPCASSHGRITSVYAAGEVSNVVAALKDLDLRFPAVGAHTQRQNCCCERRRCGWVRPYRMPGRWSQNHFCCCSAVSTAVSAVSSCRLALHGTAASRPDLGAKTVSLQRTPPGEGLARFKLADPEKAKHSGVNRRVARGAGG